MMRTDKSFFRAVLRILGFGLIAACGGCQTSETIAPVTLPGRSDAAAQIRRVAVLPFDGADGANATMQLESLLRAVRDGDGKPYFVVIDRQTVQKALDEMKIQPGGPIDSIRIGKSVHVDGLYGGTAAQIPVSTGQHQEQRTQCLGSTSCGSYTVICTDKTGGYALTPRLLEISSGRVVYSRPLTISKATSFCPDSHGDIPDAQLIGSAFADALERVKEDIGPHQIPMKLPYKETTEGMSSEVRRSFDESLEIARSGRLDRACPLWHGLLAATNNSNITLSYNIALCAELNGQLQDALLRYQAIDKGLVRPDADVSAAMARVSRRIADK